MVPKSALLIHPFQTQLLRLKAEAALRVVLAPKLGLPIHPFQTLLSQ